MPKFSPTAIHLIEWNMKGNKGWATALFVRESRDAERPVVVLECLSWWADMKSNRSVVTSSREDNTEPVLSLVTRSHPFGSPAEVYDIQLYNDFFLMMKDGLTNIREITLEDLPLYPDRATVSYARVLKTY